MTAKIKLNAASGGGSFSLQAPSSSANNRVFTLPDIADGTIATTATAGKILQVVQTVKTDASSFTSNSTNTFVDWTGLSVPITPTSSSSQVLVSFTVSIGPAEGGTVHVNLVRNSTPLVVGDSGGGNRLSSTILHRPESTPYSLNIAPLSYTYLDSPNTTSATTYKLQGTLGDSYNYTYYINRSRADTNASYGGRVTSTITAMEVAA